MGYSCVNATFNAIGILDNRDLIFDDKKIVSSSPNVGICPAAALQCIAAAAAIQTIFSGIPVDRVIGLVSNSADIKTTTKAEHFQVLFKSIL